MGKRGVGKSSTLNYLFGFMLPTDAAAESTTAPHAVWVSAGPAKRCRIVDMPGIAAGIESDKKYGAYYRRWLGRADTVVWITQANVRAYKQDQIFFRDYSKFVRPATRLVLALSKADTQVDDLDMAGDAAMQEKGTLHRKAVDASAEILQYTWAAPENVVVVPYSIEKEWNVERLRAAILAIY